MLLVVVVTINTRTMVMSSVTDALTWSSYILHACTIEEPATQQLSAVRN